MNFALQLLIFHFERLTFLVDPRGIEPLTLPCHGSMLPVYHGPGNRYYSIKNAGNH
jgi:hypothetical protein